MAEWLKNAIFYEIYPQSFKDTNADGIGDFQGIIDKLDYIKELGCNAIWMNPCFKSPFGDAGYDVSDYYTAAPRYGTNDDLKRLFDEVHSRGMHILLDLVPGHTSVEHPWFKESLKAGKNEYTDRYIWTDNIWEEPSGIGSIKGISDRDGCCIVNFFSHQPALNYGHFTCERPWQQSVDAPGPMATVEEMKKVMRFWLKMGCDGFRVDMAGSLVKNDPDGRGTIKLWQGIRPFLDEEFPEAALISEWGEPDKSLKAGFHMDFLLHFGPSHYNDLFRCEEPFFSESGKGSAKAFVEKYLDSREKSGGKGLICIPSGNHDMDRLAYKVHGDELKLAFAFLLTMPGAPFIYYGDEIGMRYVENLVSVEGGYSRTGSRSPMQWDDSVNCGFSTASPDKLYIPLDESKDRPTVKSQINDSNSLYSEVKRLIELRMQCEALQNESPICFVAYGEAGGPLAYTRGEGADEVLVVINPSGRPAVLKNDSAWRKIIYQLGDAAKIAESELGVPAVSVVILKK